MILLSLLLYKLEPHRAEVVVLWRLCNIWNGELRLFTQSKEFYH